MKVMCSCEECKYNEDLECKKDTIAISKHSITGCSFCICMDMFFDGE